MISPAALQPPLLPCNPFCYRRSFIRASSQMRKLWVLLMAALQRRRILWTLRKPEKWPRSPRIALRECARGWPRSMLNTDGRSGPPVGPAKREALGAITTLERKVPPERGKRQRAPLPVWSASCRTACASRPALAARNGGCTSPTSAVPTAARLLAAFPNRHNRHIQLGPARPAFRANRTVNEALQPVSLAVRFDLRQQVGRRAMVTGSAMQGYLPPGLHEMSQGSDERAGGTRHCCLGIRLGPRISCSIAH